MREWIVAVPNGVVTDLSLSLRNGPLPDDQGRVYVEKQRVDAINGLLVEIFAREHPPPHFRVTYQGATNNFSIKDCTPLNGKGLRAYFRNIREWHAVNKGQLIDVWNSTRPSDCPVGKYIE